jgi:hypothetical protein
MDLKLDDKAGPRINEFLSERPTAADIAREGGFSRSFASHVLAGRARPSARFIGACERLGVPVISILSESEESDRAAA